MIIYKQIARAYTILVIFILLITVSTKAQNLSFTIPSVFSEKMQSDKAPAIVNFKGSYFMSWKQTGALGNVLFSCLGGDQKHAIAGKPAPVPGAQTSFAPALRVLDNHLYLFWITPDGKLNYVINNSDTSFNVSDIKKINAGDAKFSMGLTAAPVGKKMIIATHSTKDKILYSLLEPSPDGSFNNTNFNELPNEKSKDYPFVINLNQSDSRFCWRGKDDRIYYADYSTQNNSWSKTQLKGPAVTKVSPAMFHVWDTDKLFYIWRGNKNDTRVYYKTALEKEIPTGQTQLPAYFSTNLPVSICKVDDNNFLMAYTGLDNNLYLSKFSSYDPANWMAQFIKPMESKKTLRDIVIPGAHDAGMSVLTATGGQQKGTINECNTLTQKLNIEKQLNAGIRMFDLRAGTFNNSFYAKHCASDCMSDAIGGGYGESLKAVGTAIGEFLSVNRQEIVLLSFSHFCESETPLKYLKDSLEKWIGPRFLYNATGKTAIGDVPLKELAGKVIISLESMDAAESKFPSCSIADKSSAFINFRRVYAATNDLVKLLDKEKSFFVSLNENINTNDLIRLDWQLTQSSSEAPVICNDFEDEKLNPLVNGVMFLANTIQKNKSIIDHSLDGNKQLPISLNGWVDDKTIHKKNKPNILYVDVAGAWITDFCIDLMNGELYR